MARGRICLICAKAVDTKVAAGMIAEGASDQKIANKLGMPTSAGRMVVSRHRRRHVEAPAKIIADAANKGRSAIDQRERLLADVNAGDSAAAWIALPAIVSDLQAVHSRLERSATAAESAGMHPVIAQIASQQHKSAEVRARLGSAGGYAAPKASTVALPVFNLNIQFSDGHAERISTTPIDGDMLAALPDLPDDPDDGLPDEDEDA